MGFRTRMGFRTPFALGRSDAMGNVGSGGETRTHNLTVNSRLLCRLSYPGN